MVNSGFRNASISCIVGLLFLESSQHLSNISQKVSSSFIIVSLKTPLHGRTPRRISTSTAWSFDRCGYGSCPVRTSRHTAPKAKASLYVVTTGQLPSSSTRPRISSGAIHRVDPAKKEEPICSTMPSITLDNPKSLMIAQPCRSTRMLPYRGRLSKRVHHAFER